MRKAGKKIFLEISFSIDESLAVKQALQIVADFEKLLAEKIPGCDIVLRYHSAQYMSLNQ
jgi:divalent metal cation (Fe/Co/Zn/Cd) transporter